MREFMVVYMYTVEGVKMVHGQKSYVTNFGKTGRFIEEVLEAIKTEYKVTGDVIILNIIELEG